MTLEGSKSEQQIEMEEQMRKHAWESGHIDYLGKDSFDNIMKKIHASMSQPQQAPPPPTEPEPESNCYNNVLFFIHQLSTFFSYIEPAETVPVVQQESSTSTTTTSTESEQFDDAKLTEERLAVEKKLAEQKRIAEQKLKKNKQQQHHHLSQPHKQAKNLPQPNLSLHYDDNLKENKYVVVSCSLWLN
jgi:hypothetical protein